MSLQLNLLESGAHLPLLVTVRCQSSLIKLELIMVPQLGSPLSKDIEKVLCYTLQELVFLSRALQDLCTKCGYHLGMISDASLVIYLSS